MILAKVSEKFAGGRPVCVMFRGNLKYAFCESVSSNGEDEPPGEPRHGQTIGTARLGRSFALPIPHHR